MTYVDGYLLVIKKSKLAEYKKMARDAGKSWIKHGALRVIESVGENLNHKMENFGVKKFQTTLRAKKSETVLYSFMLYKNRAHRDRVNKKVEAEMKEYAKKHPDHMKNMPFDMKKMWFGGFESLVDLE